VTRGAEERTHRSACSVETASLIPYSPSAMIHENLHAAIEDLSSRIIAIRDSL
jgi:hypothetical protein